MLVGVLAFSSSALASSAPVIERESVSGVTEIYNEFNPPGHPRIDATLQGRVNTEGLETTYQFQIGTSTSYRLMVGCPGFAVCMWLSEAEGFPLKQASLAGAPAEQEVSVTLSDFWAELSPSTTYHYRLMATNSAGTTDGPDQTFTTPPVETAPAIESESVSHVTSTDATLEAQIDVEGLLHGADYQFQIVQNPSEYASELICPSTRPQGHEICVGPQSPGVAPIGFVPSDEAGPLKSSEVSLDLGSAGVTLKPGTTYHYRVIAARAVQTEDTIQWEPPTVYGPDQTFTTPSAGTAPMIDSVSISHLTPTDATLEGQINSEGLSTMYEFRLSYTHCRECMSPTYNIPMPSGLLLGSFQDQSVSVDLNSIGVTLKPGFYEYSLSATSTGGSTEAPGGTFEPPPGVLDPPSPGAAPLSSAGQPTGSSTNSGDQPAASGGSPSSSTPGVQSPDLQVGKTTKLEPFENAQKLSKALKLCKRKPKKQRATCRTQAHKRYATSGKQATTGKK